MRLNNIIYQAICPHCGKEYTYSKTPQTPGFRDSEELICPHCNKIIKYSMEWEYCVYETGSK